MSETKMINGMKITTHRRIKIQKTCNAIITLEASAVQYLG